jgi:DNA-binding NarL/FixJ family response regulator
MAPEPTIKTPGSNSIRVVVVDEFPIFCEALGSAISIEPDLQFVGSATTASEAVDLVEQHSPDVAVIDGDLSTDRTGDFDGIEATKRIKEVRPETRVLILTGRMDLDAMARAASTGACGFLPKTSKLAAICQAIRTAKEGGMFVERELVAPLVDRLRVSARRPIEGGSARAEITDREKEVLTLLGEGLDVGVIARRLGISLNTCRGHVKSLLSKLGSHSQLEAVVEAVHQGLLPSLSRPPHNPQR